MRLFKCKWVQDQHSSAWASYIWQHYLLDNGTVQMRLNSKDCIVAVSDDDVTKKLEEDRNVEEFDCELTTAVNNKTSLIADFGLKSTDIDKATNVKDLYEKVLIRKVPLFDKKQLTDWMDEGKSVHIDIVNDEMDFKTTVNELG